MNDDLTNEMLSFYSQLLDDEIEKKLLEAILKGDDEEKIIQQFVESIGEQENDQG